MRQHDQGASILNIKSDLGNPVTFEVLGLGSSCMAQLKGLDMGTTVNYSDLRNSHSVAMEIEKTP